MPYIYLYSFLECIIKERHAVYLLSFLLPLILDSIFSPDTVFISICPEAMRWNERVPLLIPVKTDKLHWDRKPWPAAQTSELGFKKGTGSQARRANLPFNSSFRPNNCIIPEHSNVQA